MDFEALLWKKLGNDKVECTACARRCKIPPGSHGFCYVRHNKGGKLYLANYGVVEAMQVDPIEKKPFNHFMPGSYVFGVGTSSCNFGCLFCQNHNISKGREIKGRGISPEEVVELAIENNAQGVAYTYNEPAIFAEFAFDTAVVAHRKGLFNVNVTNGYLTEEAIKEIKGKIDAVVVDIKGNCEEKFANKYEFIPSGEPIKESLIMLKKASIHVEITDLIIPNVGDSLKACSELTKWIVDNLGSKTPLQFTRFFPDYKMAEYPCTPYETLIKHYKIARKNGLEYVYIGNVAGNEYENTYCPKCKSIVIERSGCYLRGSFLDDTNHCKKCGEKIPIVGKMPKGSNREEAIRVLY